MSTEIILTPKFRMSWPSLFVPSTKQDGTPGPYTVTMLFPKTTDLTPMQELLKKAVAERWPDVKSRPKGLKGGFRDGDDPDKEDIEGYAGHYYCSATSYNNKPGVVDINRQQVIDPQQVYPGRWAIAAVNAWTFDKPTSKGVQFGLVHVMLLDDADRFGIQIPKAEDVFAPVPVSTVVTNAPKPSLNSFLN